MKTPTFFKPVKLISACTFSFLLLMIFYSATADAICVQKDRANLRQGPGTHYKKLWEVYQYMPFKKLKSQGDWFRMEDVDGDIYWAHKKLMTDDFKCAVIKKDDTNLRIGPGTNFPKVNGSPAPKFYVMKVLKIENNWVYGMDAIGDKVWVYQPLVWIN